MKKVIKASVITFLLLLAGPELSHSLKCVCLHVPIKWQLIFTQTKYQCLVFVYLLVCCGEKI